MDTADICLHGGGDPLIVAVTAAVRTHMARYDASHDFVHVRRVVGLARHLARAYEANAGDDMPALDMRLILLGALLHDVGDKKYLQSHAPGPAADMTAAYASDPSAAAVAAVLHSCGAPEELVPRVVHVCTHVSWSAEMRSMASAAAVAEAARAVPELAIVQDADRLDALGAVGAARCFAFGAAKGRGLDDSLAHFDEKLMQVVKRMKTEMGRQMAEKRTARLRQIQEWFEDEASYAVGDVQNTEV